MTTQETEDEKPQGFGKWLGRGIAGVLIGFAAFILTWHFGGSDTATTQPVGNASPKTEQAPAQPQTSTPKKSTFDTR